MDIDTNLLKFLNERYTSLKLIGKGEFGEVYHGFRKTDNKEMAIKVVFDIYEESNIGLEVVTLKLLQDSNNPYKQLIVRYYNSYYDPENYNYIIEMEYIDGWDMDEFVKLKSKTKEELYYYLLLIAADVSKGLKYMHSKDIIHNDIKASNIVIRKENYFPKIIDFGLSNLKGYPNRIGFPYITSPEFISSMDENRKGIPTPESDMWALGVTLYKIVTGEYPFGGRGIHEIHQNIMNNPSPKLTTNNTLLNNVVNGSLDKNIKTRLTPDQVTTMIENNIVRPA